MQMCSMQMKAYGYRLAQSYIQYWLQLAERGERVAVHLSQLKHMQDKWNKRLDVVPLHNAVNIDAPIYEAGC